MKMFSSLTSKVRLAALALALTGGSVAHATISYFVDIDTTALSGNPAGPFYIDFQSIFGSGSDQTIAVSNFATAGIGLSGLFGSGASTGNVLGDLSTTLVLNPTAGSFYNEFYQAFLPGTTDISFLMTSTDDPSLATPTSFSVSILDSNLFNIPTNGVGDSLFLLNIDGSNSNYQARISIDPFVGVTAIPETSSFALVLGAFALVGAARRKFLVA